MLLYYVRFIAILNTIMVIVVFMNVVKLSVMTPKQNIGENCKSIEMLAGFKRTSLSCQRISYHSKRFSQILSFFNSIFKHIFCFNYNLVNR
jgi:hypothetical protein